MRPPKIVLESRPNVRFRLPDKAIALWDKTLKGPTEGTVISILSPIGKPWFEGDDTFSAKDLMTALKAAGNKPLTLNINSPGGDAFEGVTIYNLLVDHPAPITVNILGEAASAASVIAMAGDRIRMYQGSLLMIHRASGLAMGNAEDMRELAGILERLDTSVAEVYANRTGNSVEDVLELMDAETWMKPDEAVKNGFAQEVVKQQSPAKAKQQSEVLYSPVYNINGSAPNRAEVMAMAQAGKALALTNAAASGNPRSAVRLSSQTSPGVSGHSLKGSHMATNTERIAALENTRAARVARMAALEELVAKDNLTFDAAQQEEFDTLDSEVTAIDAQIKAARRLAEINLARATPVTQAAGTDTTAAAQARAPANTGVRVTANVEKGIPFARYAMAMARAEGNQHMALQIVQNNRRWMDQTPQVAQFLMTAVGAGTTTGSGWADDLVYAQNLTGDFVDLVRAATIVDRIPGLRRVPFNVRVGTMSSGTTGYWIGQGRPIPVSKFGTDVITMTRHKLAGLTSITRELAEDSSPAAETLVRDDLKRAVVTLKDVSFIDPDLAEVSGVSPASVTNGVTPVTPSGTNAAALRTDIATLLGKFITAQLPTTGGVWIMTPTTALAISMMMNALGQPEFPSMNANGGTFLGFPVVVSQSAYGTTSPGGGLLIFLIPSEIMIADDGVVDISVSREASVEMSDAPTNRADTGAGATLVSMYQNDSLAVRAIENCTWKKRRSDAVQYILDPLFAA